MTKVLIVYDSRLGAVEKMARLIGRGVAQVSGCEAVIRRAPGTHENEDESDASVQEQDLLSCDGLIIGSPTRFGNMSHRMKAFLDSTSALWLNGTWVNKPAAAFTSSSSMHGGQESTLLSMHIPLLHHGMVLVGVPFTVDAVKKTKSGGTPYGASHVAGPSNSLPISDDEKAICLALGKRVASLSKAIRETAVDIRVS